MRRRNRREGGLRGRMRGVFRRGKMRGGREETLKIFESRFADIEKREGSCFT